MPRTKHPNTAAEATAGTEREDLGIFEATELPQVDPMILWGSWPGEEPTEELMADLEAMRAREREEARARWRERVRRGAVASHQSDH